ncbi:CASP-like protein 1E1 [Cornus florida]|uniref:CASP-like protein 1E1 n=1 Tax=Cornus florida TaxID=4283 RepID=UPI0028A2B51C|nr:CASP-like protein 1E1 [Cornus florida]
MESQYKANMDGVVMRSTTDVKMEVMKPNKMRYYGMGLRIVGLVFTLVAAVVGGVNKETKMMTLSIFQTLPSIHVPVTAKWFYMSSSVYLVVSNAIASSYAAVSLAYSVTRDGSNKNGSVLPLLLLDLIMVAMLFSANGAALAVGEIGLHGNSHAHWNKVCNVVKNFCVQSGASIVMSMLGSFAFLWLVVLASLNLHKRCGQFGN